ncbi:MAG: DUF565 domain-containing protein [Synechococcaceae cyanobacterium]
MGHGLGLNQLDPNPAMTSPPPQPTRFEATVEGFSRGLGSQVRNSWRGASLALLGLLVGFWLGQNLTSTLRLEAPGGRPGAVLLMLLLVELAIRLRSRWLKGEPSLGWVLVDNLRLGATYAVVLEAFKLGS